MSEGPPVVLDPLIHEASRLLIFSVLNECGAASFTFVLGATGLTRGNLSTHMARLIAAGYVEETKQILDRKMLTEYRLTPEGRDAFRRYQECWIQLTKPPRS